MGSSANDPWSDENLYYVNNYLHQYQEAQQIRYRYKRRIFYKRIRQVSLLTLFILLILYIVA